MFAYVLYLGIALYLGILTSISPCPLATNIAAVSYIGRKVGDSKAVIHAGLLYTLGRCLAYLALASLLTFSALSIPALSVFLQRYMHLILGPLLLLLGMFLVGLIQIDGGGAIMNDRVKERVDSLGIWGALMLGILFAVSFCPTSALWFFGLVALTMGAEAAAIGPQLARVGIVMPEATVPGGAFVLPLVYGVGTAVPVLLLAVLLATSAQAVGRTYSALGKVEWGARMATGWLILLIGVHFSLAYVFRAY